MKRIGFKRGRLALLSFVMVGLACLVSSCEKDDEEKLPDGVTRIFVKTMPDVAYGLDSRLDLTGMVLGIERGEVTTDVPFSDFETEGVAVDPPNGTVLDFSHHSLTITHKPSGRGIIQPIDVTNMVASLAVNVAPVVEYEVADTLDLSDLVISLIRENGETKNLAYSDFKDDVITVPAQGDTLTEMNDKVIVTYLPTKVSMEIELKVNPFLPQSVSVKNLPDEINYGLGERLDLSGLVLEFSLNSGQLKEVPIDMFHFYGITTSIENDEVLGASDNSVTATHPSTGVNASFNLSVDPTLAVKSLFVSTLPSKLFYKAGEQINLEGLEVTLVREDNTQLVIPLRSLSKVNITTSPADGVDFDLSIPHVVIAHAGSGKHTKSPLKISIPASALDVKLEAVSPDKWAIKNHFDVGEAPYSDRAYAFGTIPHELRGLQWVQTTMDLIYFTEEQVAGLKLPGAYTVYLAHCKGNRTPPAWIMDNWESTDMTMKLDNNLPYDFYKKDFEAGEEVKLYKFANELSKPAPPYILVLERR